MEEITWKCSVAFLLGAATHYFLSSRFLTTTQEAVRCENTRSVKLSSGEEEDDESEEDDQDWQGKDELSWQPHKMVLCVRTDLKMGKGKIAAQCSHATLGAYKRALKKTPKAIQAWEMLGQAKVCLKIDSEEEMIELAKRASEQGLVNYIVIDAGRTQIAPESKTVLGIGPAPVTAVDSVTGHLKLM